MIFGANKQNKNLKEAASKTKDTSPRVAASNKYAAQIASSKGNKNTQDAIGAKNVSLNSKKNLNKSQKHRGSREGLMDGNTTRLEMNNTGYSNRKFQQARYTESFASHGSPFVKSNFTNFNSNGRMDNYSGITQKDSSSSRIQAMSKINKM